ncbi:hypothetical protein EGK75_11185 [Neisseria weixii]|uniref:Uncharacterized protein n=1 Tax=Neisseria weixii TaxID=1853276 RepID=A0A3N4MM18_9NEIS|nr:hypothetical protein EGK74_11245 [Neisseria weixii]RPD84864.1 hypothetical protein EGK75_11185 [Neisseria weixii]
MDKFGIKILNLINPAAADCAAVLPSDDKRSEQILFKTAQSLYNRSNPIFSDGLKQGLATEMKRCCCTYIHIGKTGENLWIIFLNPFIFRPSETIFQEEL